MGFAPRPKPMFPVLGPQNREYSTLNLKSQPTPFVAFLGFCMGFIPNDFLQFGGLDMVA